MRVERTSEALPSTAQERTPEATTRTSEPAAGPEREIDRTPAAKVQAPTDAGALREAARAANEALRTSGARLEFVVDDEAKTLIVKLVDTETQKVLRQIPSEEMLAIRRNLDRVRGLIVRGEA